MKQFLVRGSAAVLVAGTVLSTACSSDPTAPKAPSAARTPSAAAPSHIIGSVGAGGPVSPGGITGGATPSSGYMITWNRDGQQPPPPPPGQ